MEIKKGDRFECIKTVIMNSSGEEYFWCEHFRRVKDVSTEPDAVNHPPHYTQGKVESIDAIESALGEEGFKGFLAGNAMKYIHRYRHKNGVEDLKKANWYLNRLIKTLETKE